VITKTLRWFREDRYSSLIVVTMLGFRGQMSSTNQMYKIHAWLLTKKFILSKCFRITNVNDINRTAAFQFLLFFISKIIL
jgi:hypothetical protein